jgi:poly-beta-hydroxyalkanoate depolymerase
MNDWYVRMMLTVIAVSLAVIATGQLNNPVPAAYAADSIECRFSGPLEIRDIGGTVDVRIRSIDDDMKIETSHAFSQPGTSSSYPVYVRQVP